MLASDVNNPEFSGAHNPDSRLHVRFYRKAMQNNFQTEAQGRPIFEDVDFIEIRVPGDPTTVIDTPVRPEHKARFPMHWQAFENANGGEYDVGTPLDQWPYLTRAQVEELRALKFRTVEQIALASDAQMQRIGMVGGTQWYAFREKAKTFLSASKDTGVAHKQQEQILQLEQQLKDKDEQSRRQMEQLQAQIAALTEAVSKRGPGRPRKEEVEA